MLEECEERMTRMVKEHQEELLMVRGEETD